MLRLRDRIYQLYAEATGHPVETIESDCDRNKWLDDLEMMEEQRGGPRVVFMGSPEFALPALRSRHPQRSRYILPPTGSHR